MSGPPPLPRRRPPSSTPPGANTVRTSPPVETAPPPVPTTPRPVLNLSASLPGPPAPPAPPGEDQSGVVMDDRLTLSRLIREFSHQFPLQVKVVKGFYGDRGEDSAIAADESYNIHFVKHSDVVTIKDIVGNTHVVPLNSSCRFGIVHLKPGSNSPVVQTFDTIEQIMKADPMPQIFAAKSDFRGDSKRSSISKGEILIVVGTHKRLGIGKAQLKVFSLSTLEEKLLSKDCIGLFTTDPYRVQMYLPELVEHFPNLLRSKARLYLDYDEDCRQALPDYLISEVVTFVEKYVETSVIATQVCEEEEPDPFKRVDDDEQAKPEHLMDIPESLDIELEIVDPDEHDYMDILYEATDTLLKGFDPTLSYSYVAQDQVFTAVRKGHETTGLNIETPQLLSSGSGVVQSMGESSQAQRQNGELCLDPEDYVDVDAEFTRKSLERQTAVPGPMPVSPREASLNPAPLTTPPAVPPRKSSTTVARSASMNIASRTYENFELTAKAASDQQPTAKSPDGRSKTLPRTLPKPSTPTKDSSALKTIADGKAKVAIAEGKAKVAIAEGKAKVAITEGKAKVAIAEGKAKVVIAEGKAKVAIAEGKAKPAPELKELQEEVALLKDTVEQLTSRVMELEKEHLASSPTQPTNSLNTLSAAQVLKLLEQMGMQKYKEKFTLENVNGELLAECDDDTLQNELGVASKLDRIKIMKVVNGKESALGVLGGRGAYVLFEYKADK